jgi:hypothetical protein
MKVLTIATALLFLAIQSHAKVLVYKGVVRSVSDAATNFPKKLTIFEVIDPDAATIGSVIAFTLGGQKVQNASTPSPFSIATAPLPAGRTATIVSLLVTNGGTGSSFRNTAIYRRGTNTSLKINSEPFSNTFVFPRLFVATALQAEATDGDGFFVEQKAAFVYQQARTIAANDANQTPQQVLDTIVAELKAKGFETTP